MVRKKEGWPVEGELVIATITKIQFHSVFCNLDEYDKSGMLHISEVAPGRIKSIQEYVKEGKTLVLKVLRIDPAKGHIDLSLRRVTEAQKRMKATELKQQQIVEKILEQHLGDKKKAEELLDDMQKKILQRFDSLFIAFQGIVEGTFSLTEIGFAKDDATAIEEVIKERIKPKEVMIKGAFSLTCYDPDGVKIIREAFSEIPDGATVSYAGGGKYTVIVHAPDYKTAEDILKGLIDTVSAKITEGDVSFARTDKK